MAHLLPHYDCPRKVRRNVSQLDLVLVFSNVRNVVQPFDGKLVYYTTFILIVVHMILFIFCIKALPPWHKK